MIILYHIIKLLLYYIILFYIYRIRLDHTNQIHPRQLTTFQRYSDKDNQLSSPKHPRDKVEKIYMDICNI